MSVAELVDALAGEPLLVFGSPPPGGRDLDLLARPDEARALAEKLAAEGFLEHGGEWVRFQGCDVESLDLVPAPDWKLPESEVDALFAEAIPLEGYERLVRPAPHQLLLMIAQRAAEDGFLSAKRRVRVEGAVAEDSDAWRRAHERAAAWSASEALATLERLVAEPPGTQASGRSGRGHVVVFSGVDGSGKTSQIEALKRTLERLGVEAVDEYVRIEWMTLTGNRALGLAAAPVKAILRLLSRRRPAPAAEAGADTAADPGRSLRRRSALVTHAWVLVVALAHSRVQRRATLPHLAAGRVVVCDRYTLDARVYLRYEYGERSRFAFQTWLLRRLSPRPLRAFYLDVPPETALARKHEQYGLPELTRLTRLYREEHETAGSIRLDGERSRDELCEEIAREVWLGLRES